MVKLGRTQYAESMYSVNDEDNRMCLQKFKNKYWGSVDKETWAANDVASLEGTGEIKALYILEDGKEVHFIRLPDCSYTAIATSDDIERLLEHLNRPRRRSSFELFG